MGWRWGRGLHLNSLRYSCTIHVIKELEVVQYGKKETKITNCMVRLYFQLVVSFPLLKNLLLIGDLGEV